MGRVGLVGVDAVAGGEAARYVEVVRARGVRSGVSPDARGLVGLRSWFWVEGFDGAAVTVPVAALGLTVNVQLSMGSVSWDFGDGTVESGSLGEAYQAASSVQHAHQADGHYAVAVSIELFDLQGVAKGMGVSVRVVHG